MKEKSGKEGSGGSFYRRRGERMGGGGSGRRSKEEGAPTDQVHGRVVNEGGEGRCDGRHRLRTAEGG
jgi:hypothetical protein